MTDPKKDNASETPGVSDQTATNPDPAQQQAPSQNQNRDSAETPTPAIRPTPPKKPAPRANPSFEDLAETEPAASKPPAASTAPKVKVVPAANSNKATPGKTSATPAIDPSISIDENSISVPALVVDAIAAAAAIAFTVLLLQDALPFLK